jgi:hypothetical protein
MLGNSVCYPAEREKGGYGLPPWSQENFLTTGNGHGAERYWVVKCRVESSCATARREKKKDKAEECLERWEPNELTRATGPLGRLLRMRTELAHERGAEK